MTGGDTVRQQFRGNTKPGTVYLVGAGPGDPDLLTVKALRLIRSADVVVYDRLISTEVLDQVPAGATRIYVGKRDGYHHMKQDEINRRLVTLARHCRHVVRLKGGDPFVFGRGSEEALYLARHAIPFEIVPGVTAATACTAYAGIPLTHRQQARQVCFITGRCADDTLADLDWPSLTDPQMTVVVYMGMRQLPDLVARLMDAGRAPDTPAAVIENGTLASQRCAVGKLAALPELVDDQAIQPPALVVIGEVVRFAGELAWFRSATPDLAEIEYRRESRA
jgi:uroporphyrin-III C-methyltransferase/precorrin-2 dehydrogenase/sirohydrochlorin ferrochelatase/uroporphyrin-III C-methyltransferase